MKETEVKNTVREKYARVARQGESCCGPKACGCNSPTSARDISKSIGYSDEEMAAVPEGANLGLGCGNPVALASLKEGETVLDLGSGAGFDCFLAARQVGEKGRVIGVDMTPEMLEKARTNARKSGCTNVEFRLGEIENLPAADGSIDAIISNCVINLAPDKNKVFSEAWRVLRPGGRILVSDIVTHDLPDQVRQSLEAWAFCVAGALEEGDYIDAIRVAGFSDVEIVARVDYDAGTISAIAGEMESIPDELARLAPSLAGRVSSIKIGAIKA